MSTPTQADQLAGRYIYGDHGDAWNKLRFTDPNRPTDPKPAETLYNFIDGDSENTLLGYGTDRADVYRGGHGGDAFFGRRGDDHLFGQNGADALRGEEGNDHIYGGDGFDINSGGEGDDRMWGDEGIDSLSGDQGEDILWGGEGQDHLTGGDGPDTLHGETGPDYLDGEEGNDFLFGGPDNDTHTGGPGDDQHAAGDGQDIFRFDTGDGHDRIIDFEPGVDRILVVTVGVPETQIRYTSDGHGSTRVTWGDPTTDVLLVGVPDTAF